VSTRATVSLLTFGEAWFLVSNKNKRDTKIENNNNNKKTQGKWLGLVFLKIHSYTLYTQIIHISLWIIHLFIDLHTHTHIHTHIHTHTHTHTHIHTHTHTHTYTHNTHKERERKTHTHIHMCMIPSLTHLF